MFCSTGHCGLYYKHVPIINYASSGVNKFRASLNGDARVIIYDSHMFIVQAPGVNVMKLLFHVFVAWQNKLECLPWQTLLNIIPSLIFAGKARILG
jgi:hypothetical protein